LQELQSAMSVRLYQCKGRSREESKVDIESGLVSLLRIDLRSRWDASRAF
jgi:hypothetical protein